MKTSKESDVPQALIKTGKGHIWQNKYTCKCYIFSGMYPHMWYVWSTYVYVLCEGAIWYSLVIGILNF